MSPSSLHPLEIFAAWVAGQEADDPAGFAALVRSHPAHAAELEELHATWRRLAAASEASIAGASAEDEPGGPDPFPATGKLGRYDVEGEIARGGMGAILRVWDANLRRNLAMKVILDREEPPGTEAPSPGRAKELARFLEEARVTGQLDHPGIVPVHELGLDAHGNLYFTMKLVEGRDLRSIFGRVIENSEGWNETRALAVILKVCEAMAYAHAKGVIHRDLKPSNVMVGSFGEVFVMDWGLARVLRREDTHDLRFAPDGSPETLAGGTAPHVPKSGSLREMPREPSSAPHLVTMDGDVLGTPAYMPPEQARGEIEKLSERSDVYSIGAMLYQLLARRMPYGAQGAPVPHRDILAQVLAGPPTPIHALNGEVPGELVAICEKAMARDPAERYADTQAFAEDLRAYLENRVVAAYETGAVAELRKWVSRNRSLAAASAAGIAILLVGLVVSWSLYATARSETVRADAKTEDLRVANVALADATRRAEEKAAEAERERRTAEQRAEDVLSLSAAKDLQELILASDALWPAREEKIAAFEAWIRNARALIEGQPADPESDRKARPGLRDHRAKLDELRLRALPPSLEEIAIDREIPLRRTWNFEDPDDRWWHTQLVELIADLEAFSDPAAGLLSEGTDPARGWGVIRRLSVARSLREANHITPAANERWAVAIASIADPRSCPPYEGLRIQPQLGLVPIGRDPSSGLHEFAHLETGEPAVRDEDGRLLLDEETGLVFVLVPGGSFLMGSQAADPAGPHYDPDSQKNEAPVHAVSLDAYFLSKFEMTQGQWIRFAGRNPSVYGLGTMFAGIPTTLLHPIENVTWQECTALLARMELILPTEAQWEYATRAGTITPWWTGANKESLAGVANLSDGFSKRNGGPSIWKYDEDFDDGHTVHAPIGRFRANGFGIHDVLGNVNELCREGYGLYDRPEREHDGLRPDTEAASKMIRGGSFVSLPVRLRSAARWDVTPSYRDFATGVRPARVLDR